MKPTEVTLIDLEGKPITFKDGKPLNDAMVNLLKVSTAQIEKLVLTPKDDYENDDDKERYRFKFGGGLVTTEWVSDYSVIGELELFLNDQLTFIRNGMWEALAIYQGTLGKYWEVPWYETPAEGVLTQGEWYQYLNEDLNCNSAWYRKGCEFGYNNLWEIEGFFNTRLRNEESDFEDSGECCRRLSNASAIRPSVKDFTKHYRDVFSKLTPWEGE